MTPKLKTSLIAASLTLGVTASAAYVALDYQSENGFHPFDSLRDLQNNQVLFPDSSNAAKTPDGDGSQDQDDSYWERDDQQEEDTQPSGGANYLFQDDQPVPGQTTTAAAAGLPGDAQTGAPSGDAPTADVVYDFTDRGDSADTVLPSGGHDGILPGGDGDGTGETTGDSTGTGGNHTTPTTPSGDNGSSGGGGGGSISPGGDTGGGGGAAVPDPAPTPTPTPTPSPADTVQDPSNDLDITPGGPDGGGSFEGIKDVYFNDNLDTISRLPEENLHISSAPRTSVSTLYQGKTVTETDLFNSIVAYVGDKPNMTNYYWQKSDLGVYIRLTQFSLDNGKTFLDPSALPITIPSDGSVTEIRLCFEYRLRTTDEWKSLPCYGDDSLDMGYIPCSVAAKRVYVLTQPLSEDQSVIDMAHVLDYSYWVCDDDGHAIGDMLNLLRYQEPFLREYCGEDTDGLTHLFPGWTENGKPVDWFYDPVTPGRHILEPMDLVELDPAFTVKLSWKWMDPEFHAGDVHQNLCYIQTLTGWTGGEALDDDPFGGIDLRQAGSEDEPDTAAYHNGASTLTVPDYIQAVDISYDDPFAVDKLELPASLIYFNDSENLRVNQSYSVAEDNPYLSSEDGLLFDKDKTTLMAIPYQAAEISIPAGVREVRLSEDNQLSLIHLEATRYEDLPKLDLSCLYGATLEFTDAKLMAQYAADHKNELGINRLTVAQEDTQYWLSGNLMLNYRTGALHQVLPGTTTVSLPESVTAIEADAFQGSNAVLVIFPDGADISLEENCFRGSTLQAIVCHSEDQAQEIRAQLSSVGAPGLNVSTGTQSKGFNYYTTAQGDTFLLSAPKDLVRFDGNTLPQLTITAVADEAFAHCTKLRWVILPQSVASIGASAFADCSALEGVLIDNQDFVTIGMDAFADCPALRFVASNAVTAEMQGGYDPKLVESEDVFLTSSTYFFFVPDYSMGYGEYVQYGGMDETYMLLEQGDNVFLCAVTPDESSCRVLRSGKSLSGSIALPAVTTQIGRFALAYSTGTYTLNWEELPALELVAGGAFCKSGLQGDIHMISLSSTLGQYAFASCEGITSVVVDHTYDMSEDVFVGCTALTSAEFKDPGDWFTLYTGLFNGCSSLTDLTLDCAAPPSLVIYEGSPFQLDYGRSIEEEQSQIKLHLPQADTPEKQLQFLLNWRYLFAGYYARFQDTPYLELWYTMNSQWVKDDSDIDPNAPNSGWRHPTEDETDFLAKQTVLEAENHIRGLLGMDLVDQPTDFFAYRIEYSGGTGYLTLTDSCTDAQEITLDAATLEMPTGWYLDYLNIDAFRNSPNLTKVTVNDPLPGIHEGAFCGLDRDFTLVLNDKDTVTELKLNGNGPFAFGIDPSLLHVVVPEDLKATYFYTWLYPLAGYGSYTDLYFDALDTLGWEATEAEIDAYISAAVDPYRKQLAQILDCDPNIAQPADASSATEEGDVTTPDETTPDADLPAQDETGTETTPDETQPQEPEESQEPEPSDKLEDGEPADEPETPEENTSQEEPEETTSDPEAPGAPEGTGEEPAQ